MHDSAPTTYDLILSSGFLAFARHIGVLRSIEAHGLSVDAVVGTSSGAVVGVLWAAGHSVADIESLMKTRQPWTLMRPNPRLWRGALTLRPFQAWLKDRIPGTFAELERPLALGVTRQDGSHGLLTEGDLVSAVTASVSMPYVFEPQGIAGQRLADGGAVDRLGVQSWRAWRGDRTALIHRVARSAGVDVADDLSGHVLVETPRSGASFFSLGDFSAQVKEAEVAANAVLAGLQDA